MVMDALPKHGEIKRFSYRQRLKLEALSPVLRAHGREGVYLVKVVEGDQPLVAIHARFVVLITKRGLDEWSAKELQAIVAHEIGHEYVWEEYEYARKRGDWSGVRALELYCDGIAILTLTRLGADPASLGAALRRHEDDTSAAPIQENRRLYPSFAERRNFAQAIIRWLTAQRPAVSPSQSAPRQK
jgi:hypothetical protein